MRTVPQVAELFGCHRETVRGWISSGELKAVDISAAGSRLPRWRVTDEAIVEFQMLRTRVTAMVPPTIVKKDYFVE